MPIAQEKRPRSGRAGAAKTPSAALSLRKKLGVSQRVFARMISLSERSLADLEKGRPQSQSTQRRLMELARLYESLARVVQPGVIGQWFQEPNPAFDGLKPLEVVERGQIDRLWAMIYDLQSGAPS